MRRIAAEWLSGALQWNCIGTQGEGTALIRRAKLGKGTALKGLELQRNRCVLMGTDWQWNCIELNRIAGERKSKAGQRTAEELRREAALRKSNAKHGFAMEKISL